MTAAAGDGAVDLRAAIDRYNDAWNRHDIEAIVAQHAPGMVFENHTAHERAEGAAVREHIAGIFAAWPDLQFTSRRLYVREDLVVQEWTATATHNREGSAAARSPLRRAVLGRLEWIGMDVIPFEHGLITRKDVYSDSLAILRQVGLFES